MKKLFFPIIFLFCIFCGLLPLLYNCGQTFVTVGPISDGSSTPGTLKYCSQSSSLKPSSGFYWIGAEAFLPSDSEGKISGSNKWYFYYSNGSTIEMWGINSSNLATIIQPGEHDYRFASSFTEIMDKSVSLPIMDSDDAVDKALADPVIQEWIEQHRAYYEAAYSPIMPAYRYEFGSNSVVWWITFDCAGEAAKQWKVIVINPTTGAFIRYVDPD